MAAQTTPAPTPHVPAWKRLGLKLKYAKDTVDAVPSEPAPFARPQPTIAAKPAIPIKYATKPRPVDPSLPAVAASYYPASRGDAATSDLLKRSLDGGLDFGPSKKRKVFTDDADDVVPPIAPGQQAAISDVSIAAGSSQVDQFDQVAGNTATTKRRKSVTFTPDTKVELQSASSITISQAESKASLTTSKDPASAASIKSPKKAKKAKESGSLSRPRKQGQPPLSESGNSRAYVSYLQQFHSDKANWKFNKSKQNSLLRNLFNAQQLPMEFDDAIIAYIEGLQGAAAQQRIIESAETILNEMVGEGELEGLENRESRASAYAAALDQQEAKVTALAPEEGESRELQRGIVLGRRAQAILAALSTVAPAPSAMAPSESNVPASARLAALDRLDASNATAEPSAAPVEAHSNVKGKRGRNRKKRTEVSSDESSSDSDSSDSDSS